MTKAFQSHSPTPDSIGQHRRVIFSAVALPLGIALVGTSATLSLPNIADALSGWGLLLVCAIGMLLCFTGIELCMRSGHRLAMHILCFFGIVFGILACATGGKQLASAFGISSGVPVGSILAIALSLAAWLRHRLALMTSALSLSIGIGAVEFINAMEAANTESNLEWSDYFSAIYAVIHLSIALVIHRRPGSSSGHVGALTAVAVVFLQGWFFKVAQIQLIPVWAILALQAALLLGLLRIGSHASAVLLVLSSAGLIAYTQESSLLFEFWSFEWILGILGLILIGCCLLDFRRQQRQQAGLPTRSDPPSPTSC